MAEDKQHQKITELEGRIEELEEQLQVVIRAVTQLADATVDVSDVVRKLPGQDVFDSMKFNKIDQIKSEQRF